MKQELKYPNMRRNPCRRPAQVVDSPNCKGQAALTGLGTPDSLRK